MVWMPNKPDYVNDRRVRIIPLKVAEIKYDGGGLYQGVRREEWKLFPPLSPTTKGEDRKAKLALISQANLVLIPDQPDAYTAVLIGTGIGSFDPVFTSEVHGFDGSPRLEKELKTVGLKPDHIDYVVLPSLSYLVASNLVQQSNRGDIGPVCPNAQYIAHKDEFDVAMGNNPATRGIYQRIKTDFRYLEKSHADINLIEGDETEISPFLTILKHGAATPGYCSVVVTKSSERVLISPFFFPTPNHLQADVQFDFTFNRFETHSAKETLLQKCWEDQLLVQFPFDPGLTVGYISKGKDLSWQLEKVGDALY